jgi:tetratricopeptide (TPR) repeat protein
LHELHGHPVAQLAVAYTQLGEAYATGQYHEQALTQWQKAKAIAEMNVYDDGTAQRLEVPLLGLEGFIYLQSGDIAQARVKLAQALDMSERVFGDQDARRAVLNELLGKIAADEGRYSVALDHYTRAYRQRAAEEADSEQTLRLGLKVASVQFSNGETKEALEMQSAICERLSEMNLHPALYIDALQDLAKWQEAEGLENEALQTRGQAEKVSVENCGMTDPKTVQIKRDTALLHLKRGENKQALTHLIVVESLERQLYGSTSLAVARTLKAIGTVHLVLEAFSDAEQCLAAAMSIFEANQSHAHLVEDIRVKLAHIDNVRAEARGR